jgi:succinoglycan biosynthesis transport protein ExoP
VKSLQDTQVDLREIFAISWRRRFVLLKIAGPIFLAVLAYCLLATPEYESTSVIQVLNEAPNGLGSNGAFDPGSSTDAQSAPITDKTEAAILSSDTLALDTIEKLHLDRNWPTPKPKHFTLRGVGDRQVNPAVARDQANIKRFHKHLSVQPVTGTRLISIQYSDPDPVVAAQVVNTLAQALITFTFNTRHDATTSASSWLSGQLTTLRQQSQELQAKVAQLQQQSGVYGISASDASGHEQSYSGLIDQLQQATQSLNQAEQNRILKGAIERAANTSDADALSGLGGNATSGSGFSGALSLIQSLREQQATVRAEVAQLSARYGNAYPRLAEDRQKLQSINQAIADEVGRVKARAHTDYQIAVEGETAARERYNKIQQTATQTNNKAIEYTIAREDAVRSRSLYEDLVRRLNEANIGAEMRSSIIAIVDAGTVSASPKSPNAPILLLSGLIGAFFIGLCAVFTVEGLDKKIYRSVDLQEITDQDCKFALPAFHDSSVRGDSNLIILEDPNAPFVETVRSMRTVLSSLPLATRGKVLLVTSTTDGEGKSTLASNLAITFAQDGAKVLLIDADLRHGRLSSRLGMQNSEGLSALLEHKTPQPVFQQLESVQNLKVLPAGTIPVNPTELLNSEGLKRCLESWRGTYDLVLLSGAPTLRTTDSVILSGLADVTLFVARSGVTDRNELRTAFAAIKAPLFNNGLLYTVLNEATS